MKFRNTRDLLDSLDIGPDNSLPARVKAMESGESFRQSQSLPGESALDFRASDDAGTVRMIMSAISLYEEFGLDAHFAGIDSDGVPQFWFSADDGSIVYAAGAGKFSVEGDTKTGVDFLESHNATVETYARRFRRGFQSIGGKPIYALEYSGNSGGAELIATNFGFENGNFAGYTQTDTVSGAAWEISSTKMYAGSYSAKFNPSGGVGTASIATNKYAVSASVRYTFSCHIIASTWATDGIVIQARWYNSGSTLIGTDTIYSKGGPFAISAWAEKTATFVAPTSAAYVDCYLTITFAAHESGGGGIYDDGTVSTNGLIFIDNISILPIGEFSALRFTDTGVTAVTSAGTFNITSGDAIRKIADETVNNSSSLQDDDILKFPLEANGIYRFELFLLLNGSTVNDFKFGWSYPTGTTMLWQGANAIKDVSTSTTATAALIESDSLSIGAGGAPTFLAKTEGVVIVSSTAGVLQLRWAQNFASSNDSKVLANSHIIYRKIG